jgi:uracil DNA glycosylase
MINTDIIPVENFIFSGAKVLKVVTKIGKILIEKTWYNKFQNIFDNLINSDIFDNLLKYGNILPASEIIFNWTFFTDPNSLEIIYLCQEGYTDLKYNIGVGFCIPSNLKYNNLLQNFYKKMLLQVPKVKNENLTIDEWVKKGNLFRYCKKMLFLNSSLTFSNQPSFESHLKFWRKKFIEPFLIENKDKIIVTLGKKSSEIMISLQKKHNFKKIINDDHPSSRQLNNNYFDNPKIFFEEYF